MHFGDLDFIITVGGVLELAHATIQPLPSIGLNYERLERQLGVSLGPHQSMEDQRRPSSGAGRRGTRPQGVASCVLHQRGIIRL